MRKKLKYFTPSKGAKLKDSYAGKMSFDKGNLTFEDFALDGNEAGFNGIGVSLDLPKDQAKLKEYSDTIKAALIDVYSNTNAIYNDITSDSIIPKPEDFVFKPFRLISATTVAGGTYRATNFGKYPNALKKAVKKLANKPVYPEHNMDVRNWIGLVLEPTWEEAKKTNYKPKRRKDNWDGVIPAGINGTIAIDSKSDPKTARGLMMGTVYSNSVTVVFNWTPSHDDFDNEWQFFDALGTIHADGRMVTREVTEVVEFYESSMVALGADPFAKAMNEDGTYQHIDTSAIVPLSKKDENLVNLVTKQGKFTTDFCLDKDTLLLLQSNQATDCFVGDKKNQDKMQETIAKFLGKEVTEVTEENVLELLSSYFQNDADQVSLNEEIEQLKTDKEELTNKVTSLTESVTAKNSQIEKLTADIESLQPAKIFYQKQFDELKQTVKNLHTKAKGSDVNKNFLKMVDEETDYDRLSVLADSMFDKVVDRFKPTCTNCGRDTITYRKSAPNSEETHFTESVNTSSIYTPEEIRQLKKLKTF